VRWLAWRQHRFQLTAGAIILGLLCLYVLVSGIDMHVRFEDSGLAACLARDPSTQGTCKQLAYSFTEEFPIAFQFSILGAVALLPLLAGMFLGAPLVASDIEHKLQRVAWMQSVSRNQWLAAKLAMVGIPTVIGVLAVEWLLSWWLGPLAGATGLHLFSPLFFDLSGVVPVCYAAFALAIGVAAGTLVGRTLPAVGLTAVAFIGVRAAVLFLRPHYLPPLSASYPTSYVNAPPAVASGYPVSEKLLDYAGQTVSKHHGFDFPNPVLTHDCPTLPLTPSPQDIQACAQQAGLHFVTAYQPADRYWAFQGIEAAIFALLAAALTMLTLWWLRHRIV
jgi:hypothetical protein